MGMPLRLTFKDQDYWFQIENERLITKGTIEIPVILEDQSVLIIRRGDNWVLEENILGLPSELIQAMGRAIETRFRL